MDKSSWDEEKKIFKTTAEFVADLGEFLYEAGYAVEDVETIHSAYGKFKPICKITIPCFLEKKDEGIQKAKWYKQKNKFGSWTIKKKAEEND